LDDEKQLNSNSIQEKMNKNENNNEVKLKNMEEPKQKTKNMDEQKTISESQTKLIKDDKKITSQNILEEETGKSSKTGKKVSKKGKDTSEQPNESQESNKKEDQMYLPGKEDRLSETYQKDMKELKTERRESKEKVNNVKVSKMQDMPIEEKAVRHAGEERTKNIPDSTDSKKVEPDKKVKVKKTKTAPNNKKLNDPLNAEKKQKTNQEIEIEKVNIKESQIISELKDCDENKTSKIDADQCSVDNNQKGSMDSRVTTSPFNNEDNEIVINNKDLKLKESDEFSQSSSLQKSNSFSKNRQMSFKNDFDIEKLHVDRPLSLAKEIFAEIADVTIESSLVSLKHDSSPLFDQVEPAEWFPPDGTELDNEDELMIILNDDESDLVAIDNSKSRSSLRNQSFQLNENSLQQSMSTSGVPELETVEIGDETTCTKDSNSKQNSMSTGFSHLDDFERKLAEMEEELNREEALRSEVESNERGWHERTEYSEYLTQPDHVVDDNHVPLIEHSEGKMEAENQYQITDVNLSTYPNKNITIKEETGQPFETEEDVMSEYIYDEITGHSIKRYKKVSFATLDQTENQKEIKDNQSIEEPVVPRRSRSKEPTPIGFLSAMTGGLIEPNENSVFGSLLQRGRKKSRSRSRQGSRQSSGDRSSQDLGSEDEGSRRSLDFCDYNSDTGSERSLVTKLKKLTKKKSQVQAADFDALFARGMAMSENLESDNGNEYFLPEKEKLFKSSLKPVDYTEKVQTYLDDQSKPNSEYSSDQGHISRERRRKKQQQTKEPTISINPKDRSMSTEQRNRSREYSRPEDIQLSPVPKRDLFTGSLLPDSPQVMFLQRVTDFVAKNQKGYLEKALMITQSESINTQTLNIDQKVPERKSPIPKPRSPHALTPSPGKAFLNANTGQELFTASIEGSDPVEPKQQKEAKDKQAPKLKVKDIPLPTSDISYCRPRKDEAADKGIPAQLVPDKMLANEEFYENLREGLRSAEDPVEPEPEEQQKYSQHLGRAEFGTLKKKTSVVASRDPSVDKVRQTIGSRDHSADKRFRSNSKLSRQSSKEPIRSDSRMSDYSTALPDLEVDEEIPVTDIITDIPLQRTQSLFIEPEQEEQPGLNSTTEVLALREEVLKEIEERKQQVKDTKAWIQNGLMTVVGFGVMAYLQTLESVAGGQ